jgi:F-type H+-transporting ATPase subunit a
MAMAESAGGLLEHVLQHPLVQRPLDLGFLTPHKVITLLSDHIVSSITAGLLLALLLPLLARRRRGSDEIGRLVPAGPANFLEAICEYLRTQVAEPTLGEHTDRFVKYLWTLFFFLLVNNLLGLLPVAAVSQPLLGVHLGGTATGNIWVTGAMALLTLGMIVVNGVRLGGSQFIKHFCPGPLWLAPILVPVEILGLFAKPIALAIRLFANMFAGHMILAVLLSFILSIGSKNPIGGVGVAVPVVAASIGVSLLELFVAFLQAFIFTFLTSLFIGQATVFHHDDTHGEAPAH